jgi:hypothetical protein
MECTDVSALSAPRHVAEQQSGVVPPHSQKVLYPIPEIFHHQSAIAESALFSAAAAAGFNLQSAIVNRQFYSASSGLTFRVGLRTLPWRAATHDDRRR